MKQLKTWLATIAALWCSITVSAHDLEVDGIYYNIANSAYLTVTYSSFSSYYGTVTIPSTVTYNGNTYKVTSIGESAFRNCRGLTSITIPENVTSIGNQAFSGCSDLTSITLPESVRSIGFEAFQYCSDLTSITLPNSVTSIGHSAFFCCSSLTSITLPERVTSIGKYAFSGCSSLTSVTIPERVTSIGESAFSSCSSLTVIVIPKGVTSIGEDAFWGCTKLKVVINGSDLDIKTGSTSNGYLGYYADIVIRGDKLIDDYVFKTVDGVHYLTHYIGSDTELTLPKDCQGENYQVGESAFSGCRSLTSVTIPEGVTSIGEYAFWGCSNLVSITIPESVTSIGESAFYNCSSLTVIVIPKSVTSIGKSAFYGCTKLKTVINGSELNIKEGSTSNGYLGYYADIVISGDKLIDDYVFKTVDGVHYLMYYIGNDTELTLPNDYQGENYQVGKSAFENCTSLTSITIPEGVTSIGSRAFYGCYITTITIPESVTSIGFEAFKHCGGLTSITLPNSVTSIGFEAFKYCGSLTSITLPNSVTSIGESAFSSCTSLTSITLPNSVTSIGESAFSYCDRLTAITIAEGNAIYDSRGGCNAIIETNSNTLITGCSTTIIPEDVTSIGESAFSGCTSLTSITIPEGVTSIGESAFYGCTSLTSITIPEGVTSIGDYAFYKCNRLKTMVVKSDVPPTLQSRSLGTATLTVGVPKNSVNEYCMAEYWREHNIVRCYTITYVVDGKMYETVEVPYGSAITPIADPVKEGHAFGGWKELPATMPNEDIIVNGGFVYTVTYMVDGEVYSMVGVVYGSPLIPPVKEEYVFSSDEMPETMPAEDIIINCTFTVKNYNLIYMVGDEVFKTEQVAYGSEITYTDDIPTKEGHTFVEWELPVSGIFPIDIASNADAMLYSNAPCTETRYGDQFVGWHVLFDNDANTFFHSDYSGEDSADGLDHYLRVDMGEDNPISKFIFTYTVRGDDTPWYTPVVMIVEGSNEADGQYDEIAVLTELPRGKGEVYESDTLGNGNAYRYIRYRVTETRFNSMYHGHPYFYFAEFGMSRVGDISVVTTMPAHDVVVNALLTKNKYKVTFKVGDEVLSEEMLEYGSRIIAPNPYKEGYTFSWGDVAETVPAHDVTYEGSYSINSYVLVYVVDGEVVKEDSVVYGTVIDALEKPTKEGYTFSLNGEVPETMPAKDTVVYGTFTINKYRVTFALNGVVQKTGMFEYGTPIEAPTFPEREGYTLTWSEDVSATVPAKDVYYNAVYVPNIYQVYYFVGVNLVHTAGVAYGEKIPEYIYEPKEGEGCFLGWMGDDYETMPAHDVIFTANIGDVDNGIEQLAIDKSQLMIYDLRGRRITDVEGLKGVYIVNGKKVIFK